MFVLAPKSLLLANRVSVALNVRDPRVSTTGHRDLGERHRAIFRKQSYLLCDLLSEQRGNQINDNARSLSFFVIGGRVAGIVKHKTVNRFYVRFFFSIFRVRYSISHSRNRIYIYDHVWYLLNFSARVASV